MHRFKKTGAFLERDGVAKERGLRSTCKKWLNFYSADRQFLADTMHDLSRSNSCYQVRIDHQDRGGVMLGQCSFTNEHSLGDCWAQYANHPRVWVTVSDEEFCAGYDSRIGGYSDMRSKNE